jgi:hypothetical protein
MQITTAHIRTIATARQIHAVWADIARWPEWNSDTEWVTIDGAFAEGATGRLKPAGAPSVPFRITHLDAGRFTDVSRLLGARLVFDHRLTPGADGLDIDVTVSMTGPLRGLWARMMASGIAAGIDHDLAALVERALSASTTEVAR